MDAARLERLLDRYLDEALSPEEQTELEQMLRDSQTKWLNSLLAEDGHETQDVATAPDEGEDIEGTWERN